MKIASRLRANAVVFAAVTVIMTFVMMTVLHLQRQAYARSVVADQLMLATAELNSLSNRFLRYPEERPKEQWLAAYRKVRENLRGKVFESGDRRIMATRMSLNLDDMKTVFDRLVESRARMVRRQEAAALLGMQQQQFAEVIIKRTRELALDAGRLNAASNAEIVSLNRRVSTLIPISAMLLTAITVWTAIRIGRSITLPIETLRSGAEVVGSGNLDFRVGRVADDELGQLAAAFDGMTARLKETTVSRDDLAREMVERKRAEQELRASEARFRGIFENAAIGIAQFDGRGKALRANGTLCRILGYTEEEVVGRSFLDFTYPEDREQDWAQYLLLHEGRLESYSVEKRYLRKGGEIVWVRVTRSPQHVEGGLLCSISIVEEIGARMEVEAALRNARDELEYRVRERTRELTEALEQLRVETAERVAAVEELRVRERLLIQQSRLAAMGEMIANISHQWRQPLNVLGLIVQDLLRSYRRGAFSPELLEESVGKALQVIAGMSQTIDDFRNFFSPDKRKETFSVRPTVERMLALLENEFRQLQVQVDVEDGDECRIEGLRNEYSQVLLNIFTNARDVFRERNVEKPFLVIRLFCEYGRSVVTIADNAGGIPSEILEKIFDPYFTTKGPDKGTGIGLFMSKTIIEKSMGGRLTARNTPEGAEFRIEV